MDLVFSDSTNILLRVELELDENLHFSEIIWNVPHFESWLSCTKIKSTNFNKFRLFFLNGLIDILNSQKYYKSNRVLLYLPPPSPIAEFLSNHTINVSNSNDSFSAAFNLILFPTSVLYIPLIQNHLIKIGDIWRYLNRLTIAIQSFRTDVKWKKKSELFSFILFLMSWLFIAN